MIKRFLLSCILILSFSCSTTTTTPLPKPEECEKGFNQVTQVLKQETYVVFDLTKEEEQRKCFHYTNLQPLWQTDNFHKGSKIIINR